MQTQVFLAQMMHQTRLYKDTRYMNIHHFTVNQLVSFTSLWMEISVFSRHPEEKESRLRLAQRPRLLLFTDAMRRGADLGDISRNAFIPVFQGVHERIWKIKLFSEFLSWLSSNNHDLYP